MRLYQLTALAALTWIAALALTRLMGAEPCAPGESEYAIGRIVDGEYSERNECRRVSAD